MSLSQKKQLRAIIWCAVSTKAQAGTAAPRKTKKRQTTSYYDNLEDEKASLRAQEDNGRELCARMEWRVVDVLKVPGHSRDYIDFHELAADAAKEGIDAFYGLEAHWGAKDFDVLVVRDGDRFARTQSLHAYISEMTVWKADAFIYSLADGKVDKQNVAMWTAMSGYKATNDNRERVKKHYDGMNLNARLGRPTGSRVLLSHKLIRNDKGKAEKLIVDESKRGMWNDIATLLIEGTPWHALENELYSRFKHGMGTEKPYPPRYFHHVLNHPTFWGHAARRFSASKHPNRHNRGAWVFDENEPLPDGVIMYRNVYEPVYTGEQAEMVKAELRRRMDIRGRAKPQNSYMFSGLLVCDVCGHHMSYSPDKSGWRSLRCNTGYKLRPSPAQCDQRRLISEKNARMQINELLLRVVEAGSLNALFEDKRERESEAAIRRQQLTDEIAGLEAQARALIVNQSKAHSALQGTYDEEIQWVGEQLNARRAQLAQVEREITPPTAEVHQERTLKELSEMSLEKFWQQPNTFINRTLHTLMGKYRFVVRDGRIIGVIPVKRKTPSSIR